MSFVHYFKSGVAYLALATAVTVVLAIVLALMGMLLSQDLKLGDYASIHKKTGMAIVAMLLAGVVSVCLVSGSILQPLAGWAA